MGEVAVVVLNSSDLCCCPNKRPANSEIQSLEWAIGLIVGPHTVNVQKSDMRFGQSWVRNGP